MLQCPQDLDPVTRDGDDEEEDDDDDDEEEEEEQEQEEEEEVPVRRVDTWSGSEDSGSDEAPKKVHKRLKKRPSRSSAGSR